MKNFYEDLKKIKIIAIIVFSLVLIYLFFSLYSILVFKILKLGTIDLDNMGAVIGFFGVILVMAICIYIFAKADFSYFIQVKEGKITMRIKGAVYSYDISEIEECYLEKVRLHKKVIIKISGTVIEITSRKPKKLLESIESWKVNTNN